MTLLEAARSAYAAGLCLLPTRDDGSKAPDVSSWTAFQMTRPTLEQMQAFDFAHRSGLGVIAGLASDRRECWDFDGGEVFDAFTDAATACGLGSVLDRIVAGYCDATPGGGRRLLVTYPLDVETQDLTLARRPGRAGEPSVKTLIELPTFAIVAPSNGATHPTGRAYVRLSGDFSTIARYTADERRALMDLARTFDQMPRCEAKPAARPSTAHAAGTRPGDDYNRRQTWPDVLPAGWIPVFERGDVTYWRRPGKDIGISATTNFGGADLFYPFTSSTAFEPETSYSKFAVYAALEHGGDFAKAALALSRQGYGQRDELPVDPPPFAHAATTATLGQCVLAPLVLRPYSGWFARGAVHLIAGSSGAGKTTLILDCLRTQGRGAPYLGHPGGRLDFLVLFADRGAVSNRETLHRMRIDPATLPIAHLPPTTDGATALRAVLEAIEGQPERPAVVFVEGADLLVEDPCKSQVVMPFVVGLRHIAEHYSLAIILSVGAPKSRPQEQYQLKRDQVFGSQAWSRMADTVLVLTTTGDGTVATRDLVVLHRNAAAEVFHLTFTDGVLVEMAASEATEPDMMTWFRDAEIFTKQRFRDAFALSGARATTLLDGYVTIGVLREKVKGDRTHYVHRRPSAPKPDRSSEKPDGQSDSESDTLRELKRTDQSVPDNARTDSENRGVNDDFTQDYASHTPPSLIPLKSVSVVRNGHSLVEATDNGHDFRGYTRAREDDLTEALHDQGDTRFRKGWH